MNRHYIKYYLSQTGGNIEEIGPLFHSAVNYQRGRGLGDIFGGLFRYIKPLLSSGINFLKNEVLSSGIGALSDIASGASPKEVFQDRGKEALKNLRRGAVNKLHTMYGSGRKRTIKRKKPSKTSHSYIKLKRRKVKKVKKVKTHKKRVLDIFD